jgi:hypothetical protein
VRYLKKKTTRPKNWLQINTTRAATTKNGKQVRITTVTQVFLTLPQLEYHKIADTEVWQGRSQSF